MSVLPIPKAHPSHPPLKSLRQKHGARICAKARGFIKTLFLATATSSPRLYLHSEPRIASRAAHCIATSSPHPVQRIGLQLQPDHRAQRIASQLDHRAQCIECQRSMLCLNKALLLGAVDSDPRDAGCWFGP